MLVHSVSILLATLVFFAALVSASPMQVRDVFIPPILYPHAGTIWKVGQHHNVTWNITNPPAKITNGPGEIILAVNGYLDFNLPPLARNFSVLEGRQVIKVPNVNSGKRYALVLAFGDYGKFSPDFTIEK